MKSIILSLLLLLPVTSMAWGPKGHDIVASIAESHLSRKAQKRIERCLDGRSMVHVANWMDNASHTAEYAHTKTWHYCNIDEEEQSYAASRKEAAGDVVVAIESIAARLKSGELTAEEERDELMMLIHLVGDLHSPMHAGHKCDLGGNRVSVRFFGQSTNLHSAWDSDIIEAAHKWSYTEWREAINRADKSTKREIVAGSPREWVEQSVALAAEIYRHTPPGTNISYDYIAHFTPIIEQQLLRGGLRLAALLEEIY